MMKFALRATTSLACVTIASMAAMPAFAQEQPAANERDFDDSTIIVVTAQGREQQLSDVPVAISAVSGDLLQKSGANDIRELNQVAPSLLVSSTGNEANGSARIRGIGTVGDNAGLESSVAVFVDGVYRSRSGNALSELGPIDRIEILRGPQGTLGGRNASAGLISIYTAKPKFEFGGYGAFSYGNYDAMRIEGGLTGPVSDNIAARFDGVYFKRDGFYTDVTNGVDVNNRDRYLLRGKLLFEPSDALDINLTVDYSNKDEACCAAVFVQPQFAPLATISPGLNSFVRPAPGSPGLTSTSNPIIPILLALGQNPAALNQDQFSRNIYPTAGRSYEGQTEDYGVAFEVNYDLGGATLTSITGYREYMNNQASDTDYTTVDILYRAPADNAGSREFKTFTQEIRLKGTAFDDRLDWLVGGFFANEDLTVQDNIRFGTQYGKFASCRIALALVGTFGSGVVNPANPNCVRAGTTTLLGPLGTALNNLSTISDRGSTGDLYTQNSKNFAFFTHNIFHVTDTIDLTLGLRYTNETKDFDATFGNDNSVCATNRPILQAATLGGNALAAGLLGLSCQGNSTSELDGVSLSDTRKEDAFSGTAVLSWQPTPDILLYSSYSRGYKAGGFNLDRSALSNPVAGNPALIGTTANLQFDQEEVDAYEIGAKYTARGFSVAVAAYRQEFSNFQLNTFNGSVFIVQNVNACGTDLAGADRDASSATGACALDQVKPGVVAQGFEIETSLSPVRDLTMTMGITYTDTSYQDNLIGRDTGSPLDQQLRLLPGDNLSNAPEWVGTTSFSFTPELGSSGMSGLFFVNARLSDDYNTGSDLLYGKEQDSFFLVNARIGIRGPDQAWAIEGWAQNLFNKGYTQVAFNTPFVASQQIYSAFLAEPRTYGITVRGKF